MSPGHNRFKRTIITLKSGKEIIIRCDLSEKKRKIKFRLSILTDEYKWLRDWVLSHIPKYMVEGEITK
jgi:hypothetical protein